jgi:hypothetical protein
VIETQSKQHGKPSSNSGPETREERDNRNRPQVPGTRFRVFATRVHSQGTTSMQAITLLLIRSAPHKTREHADRWPRTRNCSEKPPIAAYTCHMQHLVSETQVEKPRDALNRAAQNFCSRFENTRYGVVFWCVLDAVRHVSCDLAGCFLPTSPRSSPGLLDLAIERPCRPSSCLLLAACSGTSLCDLILWIRCAQT